MNNSRRDFLKKSLMSTLAVTMPIPVAEKLMEKSVVTEAAVAVKNSKFIEISFYGTGLTLRQANIAKGSKIEIDGVAFETETEIEGDAIVSDLPCGIHYARVEVTEETAVPTVDVIQPPEKSNGDKLTTRFFGRLEAKSDTNS